MLASEEILIHHVNYSKLFSEIARGDLLELDLARVLIPGGDCSLLALGGDLLNESRQRALDLGGVVHRSGSLLGWETGLRSSLDILFVALTGRDRYNRHGGGGGSGREFGGVGKDGLPARIICSG